MLSPSASPSAAPAADPAADPLRVWFRIIRLHRRALNTVATELKALGLSVPAGMPRHEPPTPEPGTAQYGVAGDWM